MTTLSNEELQAIIARDLPGWKLVVEEKNEQPVPNPYTTEELQTIIERDLPGWKLVVEDKTERPAKKSRTMPGPSLAQLAAKAGVPAPRPAGVAPASQAQNVFRVRIPGGAEKVADLRNGRMNIVQG